MEHLCKGILYTLLIQKPFKTKLTYSFLSSAAKAPYLARFRVRKCGIKELEELALNVSDHQVNGDANGEPNENSVAPSTSDVWQAAIFKVRITSVSYFVVQKLQVSN